MKQINLKISVLISLIIISFIAFSNVYATTKLEVQSTQAKPGENVTVNVNLSENSGIVGAEVLLKYDSTKLEYVEGTNGKVLNGKMGAISNNEDGKVKLACVGQSINGNGTLMSIEFKVKDNVTDASIPLSLEVQKMINDVGDQEIVDVENLVKNGKILVLKDNEIKTDDKSVTVNKQTNGSYNINVSSENEAKVKYTSSDESVAVVDENGNVEPKKAGNVEITALLEDGTTKKVSLNIPENVTTLSNEEEDTFVKSDSSEESTSEDVTSSNEETSLDENDSKNFFSNKKVYVIIVVVVIIVALMLVIKKVKGKK